jgi:hypothetical protein
MSPIQGMQYISYIYKVYAISPIQRINNAISPNKNDVVCLDKMCCGVPETTGTPMDSLIDKNRSVSININKNCLIWFGRLSKNWSG